MLGIWLHLAEGQAVALGNEHRIIAESFAPARRPHQMAVNLALERLGLAIGPGQAQGQVMAVSCGRRAG